MSESEVKAPVKPVDVEITLDQADAWGFGGLSNQFSVPERGIKMPVDRDSETYNMNHRCKIFGVFSPLVPSKRDKNVLVLLSLYIF